MKYDYVANLSCKAYRRWEDRMMQWTAFVSMWNQVGYKYLREQLRLEDWKQELAELTGITKYD